MVIDLNDGDTDPHGIFKFVGAIPYVDLEKVDDVLSLLPSGVKEVQFASKFLVDKYKQIT